MKNFSQRLSQKGKSLVALVLILGFGVSFLSPVAEARLIFTTENEGANANIYTIDQDGTVASDADTDLQLKFGDTIGATLTYNDSDEEFTFSENLSLGGNELKNARIENLASTSAPTCAATSIGRIYYNSTTHKMNYCAQTTADDTSTTDVDETAYGWVTTSEVAANSVTSASIVDGTIATADIADGAITTAKIAANAVTSAKIADGAVATADLADTSVTEAKLAANAVTSAKIKDGEIATADLAANAVTSAKITDGTIATADLANLSVTEAKLAANAVTSAKITDGTIATADVADEAVTFAKTAERDVSIIVAPEFSNFTLEADGSNNLGTFESDHDATNKKNYYAWTTQNSTLNDYDLVYQWQIPENFVGFASTPIEFDYKTQTIATDTDNSLEVVSILDTDGDAVDGFTATSYDALKSATADTWVEEADITFTTDTSDADYGTFTPGSFMTIRFKFSSKSSKTAYLGPIKFNLKVK